MKYIEQEYQQLLSEQRHTYEHIISNLESHINWLEDQLKEYEKDPVSEALKEYNTITVADNATLTVADPVVERVEELTAENDRLKKELQGAKISAGRLKANKTKKKRVYKKSVVCQCKTCGTYFEAKRRDAKFCSGCTKKRAAESRRKWLAKKAQA